MCTDRTSVDPSSSLLHQLLQVASLPRIPVLGGEPCPEPVAGAGWGGRGRGQWWGTEAPVLSLPRWEGGSDQMQDSWGAISERWLEMERTFSLCVQPLELPSQPARPCRECCRQLSGFPGWSPALWVHTLGRWRLITWRNYLLFLFTQFQQGQWNAMSLSSKPSYQIYTCPPTPG